MHQKFAKTSNVKAFYAAYGRLLQRGAEEASWMLAVAPPGLGKTRCVHNFAVSGNHQHVYVRGKAKWSATWMLQEIADSMGLDTEGSFRTLFTRLIPSIVENDVDLVVDEARNMLRDPQLLETLRDLSDTTGARVILSGEDFVLTKLTNRHPQIRSRISEVVTFKTATIDDVRICCDTLSEIPVADDLVARMAKDSRGYYREIKNCIATAERIGKRDGLSLIAAEHVAGIKLCQDRNDAKPKE